MSLMELIYDGGSSGDGYCCGVDDDDGGMSPLFVTCIVMSVMQIFYECMVSDGFLCVHFKAIS